MVRGSIVKQFTYTQMKRFTDMRTQENIQVFHPIDANNTDDPAYIKYHAYLEDLLVRYGDLDPQDAEDVLGPQGMIIMIQSITHFTVNYLYCSDIFQEIGLPAYKKAVMDYIFAKFKGVLFYESAAPDILTNVLMLYDNEDICAAFASYLNLPEYITYANRTWLLSYVANGQKITQNVEYTLEDKSMLNYMFLSFLGGIVHLIDTQYAEYFGYSVIFNIVSKLLVTFLEKNNKELSIEPEKIYNPMKKLDVIAEREGFDLHYIKLPSKTNIQSIRLKLQDGKRMVPKCLRKVEFEYGVDADGNWDKTKQVCAASALGQLKADCSLVFPKISRNFQKQSSYPISAGKSTQLQNLFYSILQSRGGIDQVEQLKRFGHVSMINRAFVHKTKDAHNYEVMETLGDKSFNLAVVLYAVRRFPELFDMWNVTWVIDTFKKKYSSAEIAAKCVDLLFGNDPSNNKVFDEIIIADFSKLEDDFKEQGHTKVYNKMKTDVFESFLCLAERYVNAFIRYGAGFVVVQRIISSLLEQLGATVDIEKLISPEEKLNDLRNRIAAEDFSSKISVRKLQLGGGATDEYEITYQNRSKQFRNVYEALSWLEKFKKWQPAAPEFWSPQN